MPSERPAIRLQDILDVRLIQSYVPGMDRAAFEADRRTRDAVERCLERVSEAATKLGDEADQLRRGRPGRRSGRSGTFCGMPMTRWTRSASGRSSPRISPGWRSLSRRHFDGSAIRRTDRDMELFEIPTGPGVTGRTANQANADGTEAAVSAGATLPAARRTSHAAETRRLYATDWRAFVAWCRRHRQTSLPAAPETVVGYLASLVDQPEPLSAGTLSRRAAAIAERHRRAGHAVPTSGDAVRALLRAARQTSPRKRAAPAVPSAFPRSGKAATAREAALLAAVAARCPGDLAGLRDRALLLLVAAGIDGETLLRLDREHVRLDAQRLELHPAASRPGLQTPFVVPRGTSGTTCAMRALETWLLVSDTRFGPVFRKVDRWGNVEHQRLRADGLRRIWQRRAAAVRRKRARPSAAS